MSNEAISVQDEPKEVVMLRLPSGLKRALEQLARVNRRSLNAEVTVLLEQSADQSVEQR